MNAKIKFLLLILLLIGLFLLQKWGSWRLMEYAPLASRAQREDLSFPKGPGTFWALETRTLQQGDAMSIYLQAADMVQQEALSSFHRVRKEWLQTLDISPGASGSSCRWDLFRCSGDHPALAYMREGASKSGMTISNDLLSPLPAATEILLSWIYLMAGALVHADELKEMDPVLWEMWMLDWIQITEHFRSAPPASHIDYLGISFQSKFAGKYAGGLDSEALERTQAHEHALKEQLVKCRERSRAIRNNRVAQLNLTVSDEPLFWRWSEGVLSLVLETRIAQSPQGFFWKHRARRSLGAFRVHSDRWGFFDGFWKETWDAEDLFQSLDLMAGSFLEGPQRYWERWQIERLVSSRGGKQRIREGS